MSDPIIIVVADIEGRSQYTAHIGARVVVKSSLTPFLAAARVLLAGGYPAKTKITMRRAQDGIDCLSSTVGKAAKLTVSERDDTRHGVVFAPWVPPPVHLIAGPLPFSKAGRK